MEIPPGSVQEELAFSEWQRQQILLLRVFQVLGRLLPVYQGEDGGAASAAANGKAIRELIQALFPELEDDQGEKEAEMAAFMKEFSNKPLRVHVTEDLRGQQTVTIER